MFQKQFWSFHHLYLVSLNTASTKTGLLNPDIMFCTHTDSRAVGVQVRCTAWPAAKASEAMTWDTKASTSGWLPKWRTWPLSRVLWQTSVSPPGPRPNQITLSSSLWVELKTKRWTTMSPQGPSAPRYPTALIGPEPHLSESFSTSSGSSGAFMACVHGMLGNLAKFGQ